MNLNSLLREYAWLLIEKICPIDKNRIVFSSFHGHYSDSPKRISQALFALNSDVEIIWLVKAAFKEQVPHYAKAVLIDSIKAKVYRGSAKAIVDNVYAEKGKELFGCTLKRKIRYCIDKAITKKNGQNLYTTWHGTPLKKMGRDQIGNDIRDFSCPNTTMILGNQYTLDIMQNLTFNKVRMRLMGTPRNDQLCCITNEERRVIKKKLGLPVDKKIILFAPSFRSDADSRTNIERSGLMQLRMMDICALFKALESKFRGEWALVCRFHYHVEASVNWDELQKQYPGKFINGNLHDDMADYLTCSDVLVTDVSSSMFDFALTEKPCFLLFPDFEHYCSKERGLYLSVNELPFLLAQTFEELEQNILLFDQEKYILGIKEMQKKMGYYEPGDSAEQIARLILSENGWTCKN